MGFLMVFFDSPRATGGLEEYGAVIAGTWDAEVARAAAPQKS